MLLLAWHAAKVIMGLLTGHGFALYPPLPSMPCKKSGWTPINLHQTTESEHAIIQCWLFFHFRKILREKGGLCPAPCSSDPNILNIVKELIERTYPSLPTKIAETLQPPGLSQTSRCLTPAAVKAYRLPQVHLEAALAPSKVLLATAAGSI